MSLQSAEKQASSGAAFSGWKEGFAGVISGFGKVIAGYPFDTVKGRVQSGRFKTPMEALVKTVRHEGVFALYQGVVAPTASVCGVGGILFYFNGFLRKWLQPDYPNTPLTYGQMFLAGGGAGAVVGVVVNPIEVLKIRMQMINKRQISNPEHATLRHVMRETGLRNLWSGITPTLVREIGTFGIFFPTNEFLKIRFQWLLEGVDVEADKAAGRSSPSPRIFTRIMAAGLGGVICWLPVYPFDQIKTRMQIDGRGVHKSTLHCGLEIWKSQGVRRGFFKGLMPCLIRAYPAYAAQFILYEQVIASM